MAAVKPYLIDETVHTVVVPVAETVEVNLINQEARGRIRIAKTNGNPEDGEYSLAGSVFDVYDGKDVSDQHHGGRLGHGAVRAN